MFEMRYARLEDEALYFSFDPHLKKDEFYSKVQDKRIHLLLLDAKPVGILRYNLFWDDIPFLTLIYIVDHERRHGIGKQAISAWEHLMKEKGHQMVMTSTQADEDAQFFYRKLGYIERGSLFLDNTAYEQATELFFIKNL